MFTEEGLGNGTYCFEGIYCSLKNTICIVLFRRSVMRPVVVGSGQGCPGLGENDRGVSFTFGADVVSKFLNRHDLDLICRAHQVKKQLENCRVRCIASTSSDWKC